MDNAELQRLFKRHQRVLGDYFNAVHSARFDDKLSLEEELLAIHNSICNELESRGVAIDKNVREAPQISYDDHSGPFFVAYSTLNHNSVKTSGT